MSDERKSTNQDELLKLLREIRDDQRELIQMAKEDRAIAEKYRAEWLADAKIQQQKADEAYESFSKAHKEQQQPRWACILIVTAVAVTIGAICIAVLAGWFD